VTPEQYVQDKAARSGSSFYYAFLFLKPPQRAAITAFYAFCREIDDVVDEVTDPVVAAAKLAWWRTEVASSFDGQASHPAMSALMPHVAKYGITAAQLGTVIDGCQMDLEQTRYLDYPGLALYCHRVAGVVGEVAAWPLIDQAQLANRPHFHFPILGGAAQVVDSARGRPARARLGRSVQPVSNRRRLERDLHPQPSIVRACGRGDPDRRRLRLQRWRSIRHCTCTFRSFEPKVNL